jgi:transcription elongation factor GreA
MNTDQSTYLTSAGLDKLKAELTDLKDNRRPAVISRLKDALSHGDLSENAEYEEAKNEQAFVEGRISELEGMLKNAEIVTGNQNVGSVGLGAKVKVKHHGDTSVFTIVGPAEADPGEGLISNESPLGQALLNKQVGDKASVETPKGATTYEVVSIN